MRQLAETVFGAVKLIRSSPLSCPCLSLVLKDDIGPIPVLAIRIFRHHIGKMAPYMGLPTVRYNRTAGETKAVTGCGCSSFGSCEVRLHSLSYLLLSLMFYSPYTLKTVNSGVAKRGTLVHVPPPPVVIRVKFLRAWICYYWL